MKEQSKKDNEVLQQAHVSGDDVSLAASLKGYFVLVLRSSAVDTSVQLMLITNLSACSLGK